MAGNREVRKEEKKEEREYDVGLSLALIPREGSFHFSPFYGEWNL